MYPPDSEPLAVTIRAPRAPFVAVAAATVVLAAVALGGVALVATHLTGDVGRVLVELQADPRWHRVRAALVFGLAGHGCLLLGLALGAAGSDLHVRLDAAGLAFERRVHRWFGGALRRLPGRAQVALDGLEGFDLAVDPGMHWRQLGLGVRLRREPRVVLPVFCADGARLLRQIARALPAVPMSPTLAVTLEAIDHEGDLRGARRSLHAAVCAWSAEGGFAPRSQLARFASTPALADEFDAWLQERAAAGRAP